MQEAIYGRNFPALPASEEMIWSLAIQIRLYYNPRANKEEERMPVYTYRCENCGIQFERHQSFSDKPLTRCPECSKKKLKKVISPVRVVFKGSGFYATDHKSPSGDKPASVKKDTHHHNEHKDTAAKTETKSESTPAKTSSDSTE